MSFKCSVFGHRYGESEVEREREEDGSEVVTTIRETETCERCGEVRVISENKEVTTLETAADIVAADLEDDPPDAPDADESGVPAPEEPSEPPVQDEPPETAVQDEPPETSAPSDAPHPVDPEERGESTTTIEPVIPDAETGEEIPTDHPPDEEDDAVIIDDDETDTDTVDEGTDAAAPVESIDDQQERAPGEWPAEPTEEEADWKPSTQPEPEPLDSTPAVEPTDDAVTVPEGEFYCPECGFTTQVVDSSLRAGDFCPECHRGALEHRAD